MSDVRGPHCGSINLYPVVLFVFPKALWRNSSIKLEIKVLIGCSRCVTFTLIAITKLTIYFFQLVIDKTLR